MKTIVYILFLSNILFAQPLQLQLQLGKDCNYADIAAHNPLITKDMIVGVNWHLSDVQTCKDNIYIAGDILGDKYSGVCNLYIRKFIPILLQYEPDKTFSELFQKGILHFSLIARTQYYYNRTDSFLSPDEYVRRHYNMFCENVPVSGLLFYYYNNFVQPGDETIYDPVAFSDIWMHHLYPGSDSTFDENFYQNVVLDTFKNYYRPPVSEIWNTDLPYFKQMSKAFYMMLFKCRITYVPYVLTRFQIPNTDLDLNSDDPEKRSFCKLRMHPYYRIVKIENIEPYIPEK